MPRAHSEWEGRPQLELRCPAGSLPFLQPVCRPLGCPVSSTQSLRMAQLVWMGEMRGFLRVCGIALEGRWGTRGPAHLTQALQNTGPSEPSRGSLHSAPSPHSSPHLPPMTVSVSQDSLHIPTPPGVLSVCRAGKEAWARSGEAGGSQALHPRPMMDEAAGRDPGSSCPWAPSCPSLAGCRNSCINWSAVGKTQCCINRIIIITVGLRWICNCGGAWPRPPRKSHLREVAPRRAVIPATPV